METIKFVCNALIDGRDMATSGVDTLDTLATIAGQSFDFRKNIEVNIKRFGNWVGGAVHLHEDYLVFSTNALNAVFQADSSDLTIPYSQIKACQAGKMMLLFKTVDLETGMGTVRFRCMGSSNDRLLAEIQRRCTAD